jgi:glycosyltransferase involved in cell wall biosynthesis
MNVIVVGVNAHPNCAEGVARITYNIVSSMRMHGVPVYLFSLLDTLFESTFTYSSTELKGVGKDLYFLSRNKLEESVGKFIKKLTQWEERVMILHNMSSLRQRIDMYTKLKGISRNIYVIFSLFSRPFRLAERLQYLIPDHIFVYSPSEYTFLSNKLRIVEKSISLIPVPIDVKHFSPRPQKEARKVLSDLVGGDMDMNEILLGYMGNPFPDRLPISFFKVLSKLTKRFDLRAVIIAPPYSGRSYKKHISRICERFDLEKHVIYAERFIDYTIKPYVYSALDLFLYLYKWREAPYPFLAALEALSTGVVTLLTDSVEFMWVSNDGEVAIIIELDRLEHSLEEKLIGALKYEYFRDPSIKERAQQRIKEIFSLKKVGLYLKHKLEVLMSR